MKWRVRVEASAPVGAEPLVEDDPAIDRFVELLDGWDAAVSAGGSSWAARIIVTAHTVTDATTDAQCVVVENAMKAGLPRWPIVDLQATDWRHFEQLSQRNTPDIVGSAEAAEILGVTRQRLHALRSRDGFPEPVVELSGTSVWLRSTIDSFSRRWARQPGRPQKPRRFLVQHLDMNGLAGPSGGNWTKYFDTLEEAFAGAEEVYNPDNVAVRQEIIERVDNETSVWRFRGGGRSEWSWPTRRHEANLARIYKHETVR